MDEHPDATMYRKAIEAMNAGDYQSQLDLMADDIEWWQIGSSEPIRGKAALIADMQRADQDYTIRVALHDVVANDDHLIALTDATAERNGKTLHYRTAEILHIRDGKVTHRWAFSDDTQRIIDFFA